MEHLITNRGTEVTLSLAQQAHMQAVKEAIQQNNVESFNNLWYGDKYSQDIR